MLEHRFNPLQIDEFYSAVELRNELRKKYAEDDHARFCTVWAVFDVNSIS